MELIRQEDKQKNDVTAEQLFYGGRVTRQSIIDSPTTNQFNFGLVSFHDGAKNHFHTHSSDQILFATEGVGIVANESDKIELKAGDTAFIPAGEKHWHGAADNHNFTHVSLAVPNSVTEVFLPES